MELSSQSLEFTRWSFGLIFFFLFFLLFDLWQWWPWPHFYSFLLVGGGIFCCFKEPMARTCPFGLMPDEIFIFSVFVGKGRPARKTQWASIFRRIKNGGWDPVNEVSRWGDSSPHFEVHPNDKSPFFFCHFMSSLFLQRVVAFTVDRTKWKMSMIIYQKLDKDESTIFHRNLDSKILF